MQNRIVIYPKEIQFITGKSERSARSLLRTIKDVYGKDTHQLVTIREFCDYTDLPYREVFFMINKTLPPDDLMQSA